MKYPQLIIATLSLAFLMMVGFSSAQQTTHRHGSSPQNSNPTDPTSATAIRVDLGTMLKSSDQAVKGIEAAVGENDGRLLTQSIHNYLASMQSLETFFDDSSAEDSHFEIDLDRTERALGRQNILLDRLISQASSDYQNDLKTALDASQRVRDGLSVAGSNLSRDGHPSKRSLFGRRCMN